MGTRSGLLAILVLILGVIASASVGVQGQDVIIDDFGAEEEELGPAWRTGGEACWFIEDGCGLGKYQQCAQSGKIEWKQSTYLERTINVTGRTIGFWYSIDTIPGHGVLRFYVDGQAMAAWTGKYYGWKKVAFEVSDGTHICRWEYTQDVSASSGYARIDEVFVGVKGGSGPDRPPKTINVPSDYPHIYTAVDHAKPGDTIAIAAGTYREHIEIDKPLTLDGVTGETIITSTYPSYTISIIKGEREDKVILRDLIIENTDEGYGVQAGADTDVEIHFCDIRSTGAHGIAGFGCEHLWIHGCDVHGCEEAGIWLGYDVRAIIAWCNIRSNHEDGVRLLSSAYAEIDTCQIWYNQDEGVDLQDDSSVDIKESSIKYNFNEGVEVTEDASARIKDCIIVGNKNGVMIGHRAFLRMDDTTVYDNERYGLKTYTRRCGFKNAPSTFDGAVSGSDNRVYDNARGDFCPRYSDEIWPTGFLSW